LDGLQNLFGGADNTPESGAVVPATNAEVAPDSSSAGIFSRGVSPESSDEVPATEPEVVPDTEVVSTTDTEVIPEPTVVQVPEVVSATDAEVSPTNNIDGSGNITSIDNTLSVSDEQSPSAFDEAFDATKAVATTAADSAKNTFNEISEAVTADDGGDDQVSDEEGDDMDVNDNEVSAEEGDNNFLQIIADQNKTIDNQNKTIDNLNQTIKEQSEKLVQILENQVSLYQNNATGVTPTSSVSPMGQNNTPDYSLSPVYDPNSPMEQNNDTDVISTPYESRRELGGKRKGSRTTKKKRK
jgi:hypothetical protein